MNTRITTIALTILAGTIAANGQPQGRQRGQRQQRCPACGAPRGGQQGQQFNQGRRRPQQGAYEQQYHRQGGRQQNPQFAQQQFQARQQQLQQQIQQLRQQIQQFQAHQQKFQQDGPPPQFRRDRQGQQGPNPQQREQMQQKRRQAILELFDADRDGQLSKEERQAVRETLGEQHRRGKADRPGPPPSE